MSGILAAAFSPDGSRLLTASFDQTAKLWDVSTGRLIRAFPHSRRVDIIAVSPDGLRFATSDTSATGASMRAIRT